MFREKTRGIIQLNNYPSPQGMGFICKAPTPLGQQSAILALNIYYPRSSNFLRGTYSHPAYPCHLKNDFLSHRVSKLPDFPSVDETRKSTSSSPQSLLASASEKLSSLDS
ncbi:hypothetical protein V6N13_059282 [Hibiscus sabdariffa]